MIASLLLLTLRFNTFIGVAGETIGVNFNQIIAQSFFKSRQLFITNRASHGAEREAGNPPHIGRAIDEVAKCFLSSGSSLMCTQDG